MAATDISPTRPFQPSARLLGAAEKVVIPLGALIASAVVFSLFLLLLGKSPVEFFQLVWRGGFGTSFSFQNTLQRSAPLILTGLAFAIPAQIGLTMIGAEGALDVTEERIAALAREVIESRSRADTFGPDGRPKNEAPRADA